jgi:hypothetical protein
MIVLSKEYIYIYISKTHSVKMIVHSLVQFAEFGVSA